MKSLVLKDKMGQILRVFRCETKKAYLVYRKKKGRLDLCSSPDFFEKEKDSLLLIDELDIHNMQAAKPVPIIQGVLEICDDVLNVRPSLPRPASHTNNFWKASVFVLSSYIMFAGVLYWFSKSGQTAKEQLPESPIVTIIKPPAIAKSKKTTMMFIQNKAPVKKKVLKRSLKKIGALSALGNLSKKNSSQRGGLNLGDSKVSTGPGFRAVSSSSGSGGIQDSLYGKGMITAALGSGGNIRGGGGHGTKGREQGGGSAGYGELSLIGSGGTDALSSSSLLSSQGETFDSSIIQREIAKEIEKIKDCYHTSSKMNPNLKGLLKIHFTVHPKGKVIFSKVQPSSEVHFQPINSCILDIINQIQFPIQLRAAVGINYKFNLSALDTTEGEE